VITDCHIHYGPQGGIHITDDQIIEAMDRYGIEKALMSSTAAIVGDVKEGNDGVARMMKAHPDRIIGYCVPNPFRAPLDELKRCIDLGFRGVKLHPYWSGCPLDNRMLLPVYEEAQRRRMPLLFHSGGSLTSPDFRFTTPEMIVRMAKKYPSVSFIVGHMGLERWLDLVNAAPQAENVYLDITMSIPDVERVEMAVEAVGAERVLFGSDLPLLNPAVPIGLVEECGLSVKEKDLILGGNMERVLARIS
jgi:predicted TIM-barrel fold metal-dependent hydrolase